MPYKKKENKFFNKKKPNHFKKENKSLKSENLLNDINVEETKDSIAISKPKASKNKLLITIGIIVIVIGILTASILGIFLSKEKPNKDSAVAGKVGEINIPAGYFQKEKIDYTYLKSMKALKIVPKVDFFANENATKEEVTNQINDIIKQIKELKFNSVIVDTKLDQKVIFDSTVFEKTNVDALSILIEKAKAENISVVAVYHLNDVKKVEGTLIDSPLSFDNKSFLFDGAAELASKYELDSILLDSYYANKNSSAYEKYISYGGTGSYEEWLIQNTNATIDGAVEAIHNSRNSLPTGLLVKDVWANESQKQAGSKTKAEYSALINGFADTKGMVENKSIDFINAEISTTEYNTAVNFDIVGSWWSNLCKSVNMPLYITHNTVNANADGVGFDQLSRQLSTVLKFPSYHGSAYTNYKNMIEHTNSTKILLDYYANNYSEKDLRTDLNISLPAKKQFTTYEENVQFRGKFDPNQEVILNGKKVEPSERGGFSTWVDLKVGKNNIVLEHKGKKTTYVVERKVVIFKSVSPTKAMKVAGGSSIEVNAMAYKGSKITATLNGKTITLKAGGAGEDNKLDSAYENFQGSFTCPKAGNKEQHIGSISFTGIYQGPPQTTKGASITVDKMPDEVDPDTATGQVLTHAVVTKRYANTYPYLTTPGYPQSILYQLPRGTQDIVQSYNGDFVNLRSGKTVKANAVSLQDIAFEGNNAITQFSISNEGGDTVIRSTFNWKAPFSLTPNPYPTTPEGTKNYNFASNQIVLLFDYTTRIDKNNFMADVSSSPLFSGVTHERVKNQERGIWQYKVTLTLSRAGKYYGCHAEYEGNTLVLRFNNPPATGTLSGLTVCLDVGHGGSDNGTMAGGDILEKDANMLIAQRVQANLEAAGASVIVTRSSDNYVSLDQRVDIAHANKADILISCHHNSAGSNPQPNGVETYFNAPFSQPLAKAVQAQLGQYLNNRGYKCSVPKYNFVVTREKQFPSILIEYGFLSNKNDEQLAMDPSHQENMAKATVQGIIDYYAY